MPEFNTFPELFEAARQHVHDTGHSVYCCDDPRERTIGFACSDCINTETIWVITHRALRATVDQDSALWTSIRSLGGRVQLVSELNREATHQPPVFFNDYEYEESLANRFSPEEEVQQLENLWGADEEATAIAEQTRRNIQNKEVYEARVHAKVPTRFERDDVI